MRIRICAIGRLKDGAERELLARYIDRARLLGRGQGLIVEEVVEFVESRAQSTDVRCREEGERLLAAAGKTPGGLSVGLDERGKAMSSAAFADFLGKHRDQGMVSIAFLIGGPDGHGDTVRRAVARRLSLGAMTLPHGLARIVLAEQVYRAITILAGHPYHRG